MKDVKLYRLSTSHLRTWISLLLGVVGTTGLVCAQSGTSQGTAAAKTQAGAPGKASVEYKFQDDILKDSVHRIGIYRAFQEFRSNEPSITDEFVFAKPKPSTSKPFLTDEKDQLQYIDPRGRTSRIPDKVWGFCDSTGIYVYFEDKYQLGKRYDKLLSLGRYCYFVDEYVMDEATARKKKAGSGSQLIRLDYLLNINDGNVYEFSVDALKRILSKDPDLLKAFEKEAKPGAAKYAYLTKFNQRNSSTVKPLK